MKAIYLISYDVKDDRRLQRIHRYLKGKGIHLQKSVFYCVFNKEDLKKTISGLSSLMDPNEDDIRFYPVLVDFEVISLGQGEKLPKGVWVYMR